MNSYNLPVLDATKIPLIALDSMNQTHKEEVEIINQLGELLVEGLEKKVNDELISDRLYEWVEHTRQHFAGENEMMQNYGFPALPMHTGEHNRVLQQIEALQQEWLKNHQIEPLADFIFNEWPQWFDNHVNSMDMVTAQYLSQVMK